MTTTLLIHNLTTIKYKVIAIAEITGAPKAFFREKSTVDFALIKTKIKDKEMIKKAIEIP
ncbi:hypothetical protein CANDROIZ_130029 [Candidatus Roizmanbacteria bacterium]|nr:hypothetical protein CANDROIZ_130029 [Candidatus Roizmanbacteria bacterium]